MADDAKIPENFEALELQEEGLSSALINERIVAPIEGFQLSFNEGSNEDFKQSCDPSPSPINDLANKPIVEELSSLQTQIKAINSKISENLKILKEKQIRNLQLKELIQKHEIKSTSPTDSSFVESKCSCNQNCVIL